MTIGQDIIQLSAYQGQVKIAVGKVYVDTDGGNANVTFNGTYMLSIRKAYDGDQWYTYGELSPEFERKLNTLGMKLHIGEHDLGETIQEARINLTAIIMAAWKDTIKNVKTKNAPARRVAGTGQWKGVPNKEKKLKLTVLGEPADIRQAKAKSAIIEGSNVVFVVVDTTIFDPHRRSRGLVEIAWLVCFYPDMDNPKEILVPKHAKGRNSPLVWKDRRNVVAVVNDFITKGKWEHDVLEFHYAPVKFPVRLSARSSGGYVKRLDDPNPKYRIK